MKVRILVSEDDGYVIADVYKQGGMLIDLLIGANMQLGQLLAGTGVAVLRKQDPVRCESTYLRQRCELSPLHQGEHKSAGLAWSTVEP